MMQKSMRNNLPMAAVLGLADNMSKKFVLLSTVLLVAAIQLPGQLVISGEMVVEAACEAMKEAGAKRALLITGRWCTSP
jgi:[acyl-carrier-protein] S-malonyltransferase